MTDSAVDDLWHQPAGTTDSVRDRDALLLRWLASDDPTLWARAVAQEGHAGLAAWLVERGSRGLALRDAECWRVVLGISSVDFPYPTEFLAWRTPVEEDHAWLAFVA